MERILESVTLFKGKKFSVKRLDVQLESGKVVQWEVVDKGGNSVAIVPIDGDDNIYLVEEYFAATDERTLCLPKGMVDSGETPEEAAVRELQEEIGMKGTMTQLVAMSVSPGYLTQKTTVFLATNLELSGLERDEEHHLKCVRIRLEEALKRIVAGEITEARTIGGIALAKIAMSR